jgi:hypothetical protein
MFTIPVCYHLGRQIGPYDDILTNDTIKDLFPTEIRKDFEEEFDIKIRGFENEIENNGSAISELSLALHQELTNNYYLELDHIRIEPKDFRKRSRLWCERFDPDNTIGLYSSFYGDGRISLLVDEYSQKTIYHEITHDVEKDIVFDHPEFLESWEKLSIDQNGNSMYLHEDWNKYYASPNLGFVSSYSRRNIHEDIAEVCGNMKAHPEQFVDLMKFPKIAAKTKLAVQYDDGIPEEFFDYIELVRLEKNLDSFSDFWSEERYLMEAEMFLGDFPESIYEAKILSKIAWIKNDQMECGYETINRVIDSFEAILNSDYKGRDSYLMALEKLGELHEQELDFDRSEIYYAAFDEYIRRYEKGDVHLATLGVQDFIDNNFEFTFPDETLDESDGL